MWETILEYFGQNRLRGKSHKDDDEIDWEWYFGVCRHHVFSWVRVLAFYLPCNMLNIFVFLIFENIEYAFIYIYRYHMVNISGEYRDYDTLKIHLKRQNSW